MRKRQLKYEIKSPIDRHLEDSFMDVLRAHGSFGEHFTNPLHGSVFVQALRIFDTARYAGLGSLETLKLHEKELRAVLSEAEDDVASPQVDYSEKQRMVEAIGKLDGALRLLSEVTQTHLLIQLHFATWALRSERYEHSRLLSLSNLRLSFFEDPTAETLERYLTQAEKLENQGLDLIKPPRSIHVVTVTHNGASDERATASQQRELLDELWVHSMMGYVPKRTGRQTFRAALDAKKPHAGIHVQQPNGVVLRRGV